MNLLRKYKKIILILIIFLFLAGLSVYIITPEKLMKTIAFFPRYNPFARDYFEDLPLSGKEDLQKIKSLKSSLIVKTQLEFFDGKKRNILIYLPKGYDGTKKSITYPVLYLLHGCPGTEANWLKYADGQNNLDRAIKNKIIPPLIAVFPDGNGGVHIDTQFINSYDGKERNEDYIIKVVNYIDKILNTKKDKKYRAIGGLSAGGFGALNIGLKHQDLFGYILSYSGYGRVEENILSYRFIEGSEKTIYENSPELYLGKLKNKKIKIWLLCGKNDSLIKDNKKLYILFLAHGFDVKIELFEGGHHWYLWSDHMIDGLEWLGEKMKANNRM